MTNFALTGGRDLIVASFFFWRPGHKLQRSLSGLYRTILHDVLTLDPELISIVFPTQWNELVSHRSQLEGRASIAFSEENIRLAFSKLVTQKQVSDKHCMCFFIDGLDEYEESCQGDYKAMVNLLHSWTESNTDTLRLCVSSREYNVFQNTFSEHQRLKLQDLTENDIRGYVSGMLQDLKSENARSQVVNEIVERASEVFLWVALVVKALRERLEESQDITSFYHELSSLPDELETLFEHLLMSVNKTSRRSTYQILQMISVLNRYDAKLPLLACSFLDDYNVDSQFAVRETFTPVDMDDAMRRERLAIAQRRLYGYCRGLLEVQSNRSFGRHIAYTHRFIPEFFAKPSVHNDMLRSLVDFDECDAISQLLLAELRSTRNAHTDSSMWLDLLGFIVMIRSEELDKPPYTYLQCLDNEVKVKTGFPVFTESFQKSALAWLSTGEYVLGQPRAGNFYLTSVFYIAATVGRLEYVNWILEEDNSLMDCSISRTLLIECLSDSHLKKGGSWFVQASANLAMWRSIVEGSQYTNFNSKSSVQISKL